MRNPLTSLDELIWKQFEKITIAANKRLGWSKYDLANITQNISTVSYFGMGGYTALYLPFNLVVYSLSRFRVKACPDAHIKNVMPIFY